MVAHTTMLEISYRGSVITFQFSTKVNLDSSNEIFVFVILSGDGGSCTDSPEPSLLAYTKFVCR